MGLPHEVIRSPVCIWWSVRVAEAAKIGKPSEIRCPSLSLAHAGKFLIAPAPYLFPAYLLGTDAYLHFLAAG